MLDGQDPGSYRDPAGYVFHQEGRVFRAVSKRGRAAYEAVRDMAVVRNLMADGVIVTTRELGLAEAKGLAPDADYVLEHEPVPFVSYPFEWPFALLQRAARFHLDLHLRLLEGGVTLSDASAYNIQFCGSRPIFIDLLSLKPYREGELWNGHQQFMQQFVHPLLLSALAGPSYNNWYKGNLDGISRAELARCLPVWRRLSPRVFKQVILPEMLETAWRESGTAMASTAPVRLEKTHLIALLRGLDDWTATLRPRNIAHTTWADYQKTRTYDSAEVRQKRTAVADFVSQHRPEILWDLGCNTGEFSEIALSAGCGHVIGFDQDQGALHLACQRADRSRLNFLPLTMDLLNPSPDCGWRGRERKALLSRESPDAILALALIHHLTIAGNVPLKDAVTWLVSLAPVGVIEFVHKSDETVQNMLRFREDIFDDYDEPTFRRHLETAAEILERRDITASGRVLYFFKRR